MKRKENNLYIMDPNCYVQENQLKEYMKHMKTYMEQIKKDIKQEMQITISDDEFREYMYKTLKNIK